MLAGIAVYCLALTPPADPATYLADVTRLMRTDWPHNRTVNIVCHGHSVPAGYFQTPVVNSMEAYPHLLHALLAKHFPHAVVNVIVTGIGGEDSEQGAARFERDVLSMRPDVVTIDYSLNDRGIGLDRSRRAWSKMIREAQRAQVKVILLTPTPDLSAHLDDPTDPLNRQAEQVRELAGEFKVGLVDSLAAFEARMRAGVPVASLMAQVNHPNAAGHAIVAAELARWFP